MKDHDIGAGTRGHHFGGRVGRTHVRPVVRVGHPALDAALAAQRNGGSALSALRGACERGKDAALRYSPDAPAPAAGRLADTMSLTPGRATPSSSTLHVSTTHRVIDAGGRARDIRVWHELATHHSN